MSKNNFLCIIFICICFRYAVNGENNNTAPTVTKEKNQILSKEALLSYENKLSYASQHNNLEQDKHFLATVIVLDFEKEKSYSGRISGRKIAELLEKELYGSYQPLDRRYLNKVAKEIKFQNSDLVESSTKNKMGHFIGADFIITGVFYQEDGKLFISGRCIEVKTGKLKRVAKVSTSIDDLENALSKLGWLLTEPNQSFMLTQAKKHLKLANYTLAVKILNKIVLKTPSNENKALLHYAQKMFNKQQATALLKTKYDNLIATGKEHLRKMNIKQAKTAFRQALNVSGFEYDELAITGLTLCDKKYDYIKQHNQAETRMFQTLQQAKLLLNNHNKIVSTKDMNELQNLQKRIVQQLKSNDALFLGTQNILLLQSLRLKLQKIIVLNLCRVITPGKSYIIPLLGTQMRYIPSGRYMVGSHTKFDEQPQHSVTIAKGYWIAATETIQYNYQKICRKNPSCFKNPIFPVSNILWEDAVRFCRLLTQKERINQNIPDGYEYRLPTEAEWEIAASLRDERPKFNYSGSNKLKDVGWYKDNSKNQPHATGILQANAMKLYDMSGNVYEWCLDSCNFNKRTGIITDTYYNGVVDPLCKKGTYKIIRGGSYNSPAGGCRTSFRFFWPPKCAGDYVGFRIVLAPVMDYKTK